MVRVSISLAALGLAGFSAAAICNNNCGRQVAGTAVNKVPYETRRDMCSSFLATTTTITSGVNHTPTGVSSRNVHYRNAMSPSVTVTGELPPYATYCDDNVEYWSACQCFGITPTTVTVVKPTPTTNTRVTSSTSTTKTTTKITSSTSTTSSTTKVISSTSTTKATSSTSFTNTTTTTTKVTSSASTSTIIPLPTCTLGIEFALWVFNPTSAEATILQNAYRDFSYLNRNSLLGGATPLQSGIVSQVGSIEQSNYGLPLQFDGLTAPGNTAMPFNVLEHRGYIVPAAAGDYKVLFTLVDDLAAVWIGNHAITGIILSQSVLNGTLGSYSDSPLTYIFTVSQADVGKPIPIRIFWANAGGPAGHLWKIIDYNGTEILGYGTPKNPQIVVSCSGLGINAPEWPVWGTEL